MKKIFSVFMLVFFVSSLFQSCNKEEYGPNDIRINNVSSFTYTNVHVDTSEGINEYGTINPGETTEYMRFKQSFNKADITLMIDGVQYSTESVNFTALVPLVKGKLTYDIDVDTLTMIISMNISEILPL
ncbi:MAG: hypothetical protein U9N53_00585 [Bacteroidota bacterium]|nr:hypothetical protein [Bacteroidota bacterium]